VSVSLENDGVFFAVNGRELQESIKPVLGSVRLSAQVSSVGDGVSLLEETVRRLPSEDPGPRRSRPRRGVSD